MRRLNTQCAAVTTVDGPTSVAVHDARRLIEAAWSAKAPRRGRCGRAGRGRRHLAPAEPEWRRDRPVFRRPASRTHVRKTSAVSPIAVAKRRIGFPVQEARARRNHASASTAPSALCQPHSPPPLRDGEPSAHATGRAWRPRPRRLPSQHQPISPRQVCLTGGSSRDGDPRGFRLRFLGFQAADVENSHRVSGHEAIQNAGCRADRGAGRVRHGRALPACATASAHHPAAALDSAGAEGERAARFQGARA